MKFYVIHAMGEAVDPVRRGRRLKKILKAHSGEKRSFFKKFMLHPKSHDSFHTHVSRPEMGDRDAASYRVRKLHKILYKRGMNHGMAGSIGPSGGSFHHKLKKALKTPKRHRKVRAHHKQAMKWASGNPGIPSRSRLP